MVIIWFYTWKRPFLQHLLTLDIYAPAMRVKQEDGLDYIEIIVEPCNIPIAYKGTYHYRSGSTKQELRGTALQQFILKKMIKTFDNVC